MRFALPVLIAAAALAACGPPPAPYFGYANRGVDSSSTIVVDEDRQVWLHSVVVPTGTNRWSQTGEVTQSQLDAIQQAVEALPAAPGPACTGTATLMGSLVWSQTSGDQTWNVCGDGQGHAVSPYDTAVPLIQAAGK